MSDSAKNEPDSNKKTQMLGNQLVTTEIFFALSEAAGLVDILENVPGKRPVLVEIDEELVSELRKKGLYGVGQGR